MEGTAALRGAASRWSLAGDQQLLDLLQDIHQRIITKCNETNKRLEEMSRGLRDASVNLQNVNNKFLALSNTQFVESRVYDDDADVTPPTTDKEPVKPADLVSDLTKLKESLRVLESYHEPLLIVRDSDSDSDSGDNDDRLVLKPKDLYADRPLPYIIGSHAWRSKWHAGLVADESDSDSSTSRVEEVEQYSDSEDDRATQEQSSMAQDFAPARKVSTGSSSLQPPAPAAASPARPSPAAVAAELARRLGGDAKVPEREPVYTQPETVARKLYKPQEPLATTIFPDEPPPLDEESSDDDIFAELHKTQPKPYDNRADGLFDFSAKPNHLEEALFGPTKVQTNHTIDRPPLFAEDSEPEVTEIPKTAAKQPEDNIKKPVGGISMFGTNKHAESIGAAILKRNRRKSSTSGDESNTEEVKVPNEVKPVKEVQEVNKERDIFDDLFAKSETLNKKHVKTEVTKNAAKPEVQPKEVKKKDIFSDIFDDIDDIFSSDIVNVQVKETKKNEKSLFSDDDDLFAEISKVNKDIGKGKVADIEKSDLFSGVTPNVDKSKSNEKSAVFPSDSQKMDKNNSKKESKVIKEIKETRSLFDSDSDDGLFTNVTKDVKQNISKTVKPVEYKLKDDLFDNDEDDVLFGKTSTETKTQIAKNTTKVPEVSKKPLFDSDDELFKDTKHVEVILNVSVNNDVVSKVNKNDALLIETPVNVSEKEIVKHDKVDIMKAESDDLKPKEVPGNPAALDIKNNDIFNDETPTVEFPKESTPEASHDSFDDDEPYATDAITKNDTKETNKFTKVSEDNKIDEKITDMFDKPNEHSIFKENVLRTTRIASDDEKNSTETKAQDLFTDTDDDLFRIKSKVPNTTESNKQKDETPNPTVEPQSSELFTKPSKKNDIFSDIFDDVPPVFEKPKEPKRSKNVNALFDDDSDDESLFFKKNDNVTDEIPAFSPSEERFGIFNDEPPAIEVDFTQKTTKKEVVHQSQTTGESPTVTDNIPAKTVKTDNVIDKLFDNYDAPSREGEDATDNTNKELKKIGKLKPMNININVNSLLPGASPKKKQVENVNFKQDQTASNEELHKTLKDEPKIVKSISFDDPEILDNKISKERAKIQVKRRPSTRRARKEAARMSAIDFTDSSFDSSNDNSTKEEVKEKIVKTVYILNDDDIFGTPTTNNETVHAKKHLNIVDSDEELFKKPKSVVTKNVKVTNDDKQSTVEIKSALESDDDDAFKTIGNTPDIAKDEIDTSSQDNTPLESNKNVETFKDKQENEIKTESINKKSEGKSFLDSDDGDDLFRQTSIKPPHYQTANILNNPNTDSDDLFRNATKPVTNQTSEEATSFLNSNDDDDLFKTKTTKEIKPVLKNISSDDEDLFRNRGIATLGKVYKKEDTNVKEHNIFDDFPSEFNVSDNFNHEATKSEVIKEIVEEKTVKVEKVKKSILDDLSDEDDLFKSKTKLMTKPDKSLFGDDDDSDDLFGTKPAKEVKPVAPATVVTKEPKPAEPVFADPLSLFGDDD